MKKQIRMGVVGCGGIANSVHGPSYVQYAQKKPLIRVACADIDQKRSSAFAERFGFDRYYSDYAEMIEHEDLDAICVLTTETLTAKIAMDIMDRCDAALFIEKPPGRTPLETREMIEKAKEKGILNQVAFNRRHMPLIQALKARAEGVPVEYIRCDFYRDNRYGEDFSTTAIHGIDTVCSLIASPVKSARFQYQEMTEVGKSVCNMYVDLSFYSGAIAHLAFCPMAGAIIERITMNARDRTLMAYLPVWNAVDAPGRLIEMRDNKVISDLSGADFVDSDEMCVTNGFYAENAAFFDDIAAGVSPKDNLETALVSVEIADCIRRRVDWYEFS